MPLESYPTSDRSGSAGSNRYDQAVHLLSLPRHLFLLFLLPLLPFSLQELPLLLRFHTLYSVVPYFLLLFLTLQSSLLGLFTFIGFSELIDLGISCTLDLLLHFWSEIARQVVG